MPCAPAGTQGLRSSTWAVGRRSGEGAFVDAGEGAGSQTA